MTNLEDRAKKIKAVFLDVDGVLTDGKLWIGPQGELMKVFDSKDGLGLKRLIQEGIEVILITGRQSQAVDYRAEELGIKEVYQGVKDKGNLLKDLVSVKRLKKEEICAMGDDLPDLGMFEYAGLTIAVADAVKEIRDMADIIMENKGGNGAVRELSELILKAKNKWK